MNSWSSDKPAERLANRFMAERQVWGSYTLDLGLESLLTLTRTTGQTRYRDYVWSVVHARGWTPQTVVPWRQQPFTCLTWALHVDDGQAGWLEGFRAESERMRAEVDRGPEGILLHAKPGGGAGVLLDAFQEYVARCARMFAITGDATWSDEAGKQVRLHRAALRNEQQGWWHNARGWGRDPRSCSPGAWSRGHGWLLRGLSEVLLCLPRESATYREVREVVLEVAEVLVQRQDHEGFWHALLQLPHAESPVESSGTGLLAWHLNLLVKAGHLPDAPFGEAARRAAHALQQCVAENGAPLYACPGPGPLVDDTAYRGPGPFPPGEAHGVFSVLLGLLAGSE